MPDPTPERIAAALALAAALYADCLERGAYDHHTAGDDTYNAVVAKLRVYVHASKPKLRTRAEVDAEIVATVRRWHTGAKGTATGELAALCAEPTAEAEPNRVTDHDADQRPEDPNHTGVIQPPAYAAGATLSDVEACSCEESEALKARIEAILSHVIIVHGTSYRVRDLLAVQPLVKEALK